VNEPIDRQDRPPKPGPAFEIVRLRASQRIVISCLGELWGVYTHWNGRCSEPCFKDHKKCPGHRRGLPRRWKGYLHASNHVNWEEFFLELTPLAASCLLAQCPKQVPLRGQQLEIVRGKGDRARLAVTVLPSHGPGVQLPKAKDPYPLLAKLWGIDDSAELFGGETDLPMET
jgi:hypothetical protein